MTKKITMLCVFFIFVLSLAACAGSPATSSTANSAELTTETKLALGTLKLEGTALAVSAEQAQELLPLWKAVKSLSSDANTAQEEISALYEQTQETMSAEQMAAIEAMSFDDETLNSLAQQYDVQQTTGSAASEQSAATRSQTSGSGASGMQGGGTPPDDMSGGAQMAGQQPGTTTAAMQAITNGAGNTNLVFVEPLIELLKERAG